MNRLGYTMRQPSSYQLCTMRQPIEGARGAARPRNDQYQNIKAQAGGWGHAPSTRV